MAIGTKIIGYTALNSTTDVLLGGANLKLPDGAKEILGVYPYVTSPAGNTANEPVAAVVTIQSDDVKGIQPYQVLCEPIGSSLLKSCAQPQGKSCFMPMYCPVNGGEELKIYGTGLFNHTIEPYAACLVVYSDTRTGKKQVFSKISTFTNTGIAAARVSGGTVTVTGASRLIEVRGFAVGTTVAALKGLAGYFDFTSDDFSPSWVIHLPIEPASGQVDTNIVECIAGVAKKKVDIGLRSHSVINIGFMLSVALTTTGNFVSQVVFN